MIASEVEVKLLSSIRESNRPLSFADVRSLYRELTGKSIAPKTLSTFLKVKHGIKLKKAKYVPLRVDTQDSLLQRQFSAAKYIEFLSSGARIINIDETVLNKTFSRGKGLCFPKERLYLTGSERICEANLIAGVSSHGDAYLSLNVGPNNSLTIALYMVSLVKQLDSEDRHWRESTLIVLDNATYHKSHLLREIYSRLRIPVLFLGPYHFEMAPVENFFSFIKSRDLNPLGLSVASR